MPEPPRVDLDPTKPALGRSGRARYALRCPRALRKRPAPNSARDVSFLRRAATQRQSRGPLPAGPAPRRSPRRWISRPQRSSQTEVAAAGVSEASEVGSKTGIDSDAAAAASSAARAAGSGVKERRGG